MNILIFDLTAFISIMIFLSIHNKHDVFSLGVINAVI